MNSAEHHERARRTHEAAARLHDEAVTFWTRNGDLERADLERRARDIERASAVLEGDWVRLSRERPIT